jgi:hypothetical protein
VEEDMFDRRATFRADVVLAFFLFFVVFPVPTVRPCTESLEVDAVECGKPKKMEEQKIARLFVTIVVHPGSRIHTYRHVPDVEKSDRPRRFRGL